MPGGIERFGLNSPDLNFMSSTTTALSKMPLDVSQVWRWSPADVSFVNLTNRDKPRLSSGFSTQENPLGPGAFQQSHDARVSPGVGERLVFGAMGRSCGSLRQVGQVVWHNVWPTAWAPSDASQFDEASTGAWLVAPRMCLPMVQHQRILVNRFKECQRRRPCVHASSSQLLLTCDVRRRQCRKKHPVACRWNRPFLLVGANGVRGWRFRTTLGPGNTPSNAFEGNWDAIARGGGRSGLTCNWMNFDIGRWSELWQVGVVHSMPGNVWLHGKGK